ncbi:hypothetical protein LZ30DRAFT_81378 [Colletotrichum cereale]|nr:hypothetical protein LZ30DRAFT_81378 [Colletotrichum cereale]
MLQPQGLLGIVPGRSYIAYGRPASCRATREQYQWSPEWSGSKPHWSCRPSPQVPVHWGGGGPKVQPWSRKGGGRVAALATVSCRTRSTRSVNGSRYDGTGTVCLSPVAELVPQYGIPRRRSSVYQQAAQGQDHARCRRLNPGSNKRGRGETAGWLFSDVCVCCDASSRAPERETERNIIMQRKGGRVACRPWTSPLPRQDKVMMDVLRSVKLLATTGATALTIQHLHTLHEETIVASYLSGRIILQGESPVRTVRTSRPQLAKGSAPPPHPSFASIIEFSEAG